MRSVLPLVMIAAAAVTSPSAFAQVAELPNIPLVRSGWQDTFWTHADGTKFHYLDSGIREEPDSAFAKMIPPEPQGTAPLDAEARKLYVARQAAEAARAGVSNTDDDSQLSWQPVPAAVTRPPLNLQTIDFPILAVVGEFDQPYARTHRLWREAKNFQRVILRNRGHLSSYMAGLCPELYRDALTDFVVRNNPRK